MFDIGWSEILVVGVVTAIVIGPEEIPVVMRNLGRVARRLFYLKYALSQQFEDFMREHDLDDLRKQVNFEDKQEFNEAEADEAEKEEDEKI